MHVSIVRPSLVYGPGVKGNLQLMLSAVKKGLLPPLPETGNKRSMIHVDDLVDILLLVEKDNRANGEIFIATDGNTYSSNEIYSAMSKSLNKNIKNEITDLTSKILIISDGINNGKGLDLIDYLDINNKFVSLPGGNMPKYKDGVLEKPIYDQKSFLNPHDVCIDNDDSIYVPQWNSGKTYPVKLIRT